MGVRIGPTPPSFPPSPSQEEILLAKNFKSKLDLFVQLLNKLHKKEVNPQEISIRNQAAHLIKDLQGISKKGLNATNEDLKDSSFVVNKVINYDTFNEKIPEGNMSLLRAAEMEKESDEKSSLGHLLQAMIDYPDSTSVTIQELQLASTSLEPIH